MLKYKQTLKYLCMASFSSLMQHNTFLKAIFKRNMYKYCSKLCHKQNIHIYWLNKGKPPSILSLALSFRILSLSCRHTHTCVMWTTAARFLLLCLIRSWRDLSNQGLFTQAPAFTQKLLSPTTSHDPAGAPPLHLDLQTHPLSSALQLLFQSSKRAAACKLGPSTWTSRTVLESAAN